MYLLRQVLPKRAQNRGEVLGTDLAASIGVVLGKRLLELAHLLVV